MRAKVGGNAEGSACEGWDAGVVEGSGGLNASGRGIGFSEIVEVFSCEVGCGVEQDESPSLLHSRTRGSYFVFLFLACETIFGPVAGDSCQIPRLAEFGMV